ELPRPRFVVAEEPRHATFAVRDGSGTRGGALPAEPVALAARAQGLDDGVYTGIGVLEIFADAVAFVRSERGDERENAAQSGGNVVNIIHHADGFARKWHTFHNPRFRYSYVSFHFYRRGDTM